MLLLLDPKAVRFPDHAEPGINHVLPTGLSLVKGADGVPAFSLLSWVSPGGAAAGGVLRMRLSLDYPVMLPRDRRIEPGPSWYRVRLRAVQDGEDEQTGQWRPIVPSGGELVSTGVSLLAEEAALALALVQESDPRSLEVDVRLGWSGLAPPIHWIAEADAEPLMAQLFHRLGDRVLSRDEIRAAFLSLPETTGAEGILRWRRQVPTASDPGRDARLEELFEQALPILFIPEGADGFRLNLERPPEILRWSLSTPRVARQELFLSWSISSFFSTLSDPAARERHFPVVRQAGPLERAELHLLKAVPIDASGLRRLVVNLRYPGPTGEPVQQSLSWTGSPGEREHERIPVIRRTFTDFAPEVRIDSVIAPPGGQGWPLTRTGTWGPLAEDGGLVLVLDGERLGLQRFDLGADMALFEHAAEIAVELWAGDRKLAALSLNPQRSEARLAFEPPGAPLRLRAEARPWPERQAEPVVLHDGPVEGSGWQAPAHALEALLPQEVELRLEPSVAERYPLVVLELAQEGASGPGLLRVLEPGEVARFGVLRPSVFHRPRFRYLLSFVGRAADGSTRPLHRSSWIEAEEASLSLDPGRLEGGG